MAIYEIEFSEESYYRVKIEANAPDEIFEKLLSGDYFGELELSGGEILEDFEIKAIDKGDKNNG